MLTHKQINDGLCKGITITVYDPILHKHGWKRENLDEFLTVKQAIAKFGRTFIFQINNSSVHHLVAVKNGVVRDAWNSSKTRTIMRIWTPPQAAPVPAPAPAHAPVVEIPTNWTATVICGPEFGETLPKIFTNEIRLRIARQQYAGASMRTWPAPGAGRSAASTRSWRNLGAGNWPEIGCEIGLKRY